MHTNPINILLLKEPCTVQARALSWIWKLHVTSLDKQASMQEPRFWTQSEQTRKQPAIFANRAASWLFRLGNEPKRVH